MGYHFQAGNQTVDFVLHKELSILRATVKYITVALATLFATTAIAAPTANSPTFPDKRDSDVDSVQAGGWYNGLKKREPAPESDIDTVQAGGWYNGLKSKRDPAPESDVDTVQAGGWYNGLKSKRDPAPESDVDTVQAGGWYNGLK
ncbi:uncharacterized protein Z518_00305 [Rhinocladiella mackenziei CBS 650.93]|uniref:Rhinocladiella mackenziei CBS 650.93 unplaced genomic scaffold supercont1.1, whole genome shotgun sequence n=1 Tax=Rhinocladiella mackenziei CBS 650.93 TaxID=1442369 RepID=A0A0D2J0M4_9EURO|nr:uncharacterized protein Z518_00305 [Rhinocladiella mackenziei CBS 650.93]KIX09226.1 hypothetical protein Z518_00305 [Rhinocladiella mackenziei CBS 650.93]